MNKRTLTISTVGDADDSVELSVHDTGPCVPPEILRHVFDPFYTTGQGGMGLGLTISQSIIEAHGGRLEANSDAHGTTFRFTLPTHDALSHGESEEAEQVAARITTPSHNPQEPTIAS